MNAPILTRRSFGKAVGGLVVAFSLDPAEILAQGAGKPAPLPGSLNTNRSLRAWVRIGGDGNATVSTGKVELGQGILTALWQIAAEELDLPLERVTIYSADTALSPDEGQTAGSQSIENSGTALRFACAEVRGMLVDIAAAKLAVPAGLPDRCRRRHPHCRSPEGHLCRGRRRPRSRQGGHRQGRAEARHGLQDRRPVDAASRHPRQGHRPHLLCAGHLRGRHRPRPRGAAAPLRLDAGKGRRRCRQQNAGRHQGGARRVIPGRGRRARGAGDQGARGAGQGRNVEARTGIARSGQHPRPPEIASQHGLRAGRQAGTGAGRQCANARSELHQAVPVARLDRPVLCGCDLPQQPDDRVDPFARRVPAPQRAGQGAEAAGQGYPLHACRGLRLLRPERRRRRCARRSAARARGA